MCFVWADSAAICHYKTTFSSSNVLLLVSNAHLNALSNVLLAGDYHSMRPIVRKKGTDSPLLFCLHPIAGLQKITGERTVKIKNTSYVINLLALFKQISVDLLTIETKITQETR